MNLLLKIIQGKNNHELVSTYANIGESHEAMRGRAQREYEDLKRKLQDDKTARAP